MCLRNATWEGVNWKGKFFKFFLQYEDKLYSLYFPSAGPIERNRWHTAKYLRQRLGDRKHFGKVQDLNYAAGFHGFTGGYPSYPPQGPIPDAPGWTIVVIECEFRGGGMTGLAWSSYDPAVAVVEMFIPGSTKVPLTELEGKPTL